MFECDPGELDWTCFFECDPGELDWTCLSVTQGNWTGHV